MNVYVFQMEYYLYCFLLYELLFVYCLINMYGILLFIYVMVCIILSLIECYHVI